MFSGTNGPIKSMGELTALCERADPTFGPWGRPIYLTQRDVDDFASISGDYQWIHVDHTRAAKESPFGRTEQSRHGKTIVPGDLLLAKRNMLMPVERLFGMPEAVYTMHGFGRYKFGAAVVTGRSLRACARLQGSRYSKGSTFVTLEYKVGIVEEGDEIALSGTLSLCFVDE